MNKKWLCLAVVATLLAGCATHRINWGARIGTYTLDQAIVELGPPDKQAKLSDGRRVAEWISHYSDPGVVTFGTGFWGYPGTYWRRALGEAERAIAKWEMWGMKEEQKKRSDEQSDYSVQAKSRLVDLRKDVVIEGHSVVEKGHPARRYDETVTNEIHTQVTDINCDKIMEILPPETGSFQF